MRKVLGVGVLVLGVAALGFWGRGHHAHRMQDRVMQAAEQVLSSSVHGMTAMVSGRDIRVSGIADGRAEHDAILAAMDQVTGRRVVVDDLKVLDVAAPFSMDVVKTDAGITASGFIPTEAARAELAAALGEAAQGLTLAAGAPAGWLDLAKAGIAALGPMIAGEAKIVDGTLSITGQALSPVERDQMLAALSGLPEGAVTTDVTLVDDGTPAAYDLTYDATAGGKLAGKLPVGVTVDAIASALGLTTVMADVKAAVLGDAGDIGLFGKLKKWLPDLETLKVAMTPGATTVEAGVGAGADLTSITQAMAADLGDGVALTVVEVAATGDNGTERVNAATGAKERLSNGFWLPMMAFDVGTANCQTQADSVLAGASVNFISGSDTLDASALRVLNNLAGAMAACAEAGLKAEIGGHTDAEGDADANLGLSQKRAVAVRKALIARGVPGAVLRAQGYGATQPIADNATEEGRALNRRTTVKWSE